MSSINVTLLALFVLLVGFSQPLNGSDHSPASSIPLSQQPQQQPPRLSREASSLDRNSERTLLDIAPDIAVEPIEALVSPSSSTPYDASRSSRQTRSINSINMDQWKRIAYFRMDPKTGIKLSDVDGSLLTHIILAFARIDSEGNLTFDQEEDEKNYFSDIKGFKRKYPHIKLMISVFNEQTHNGFPRAARSEIIRRKFARSAVEFLQRHDLDGIDLDWEFPNFPQTIIVREYERQGFSKILTSLRSAIVENYYDRQHAQQQQQPNNSYHISTNPSQGQIKQVEAYLLTVAIAGQDAVISSSYELKEVANLTDWLNVMSYDYYQFKAYSPFTGPNSPLYPIVDHYVPIMSKLAHSWTYNRLINEEGIPREKIVLGIPTYARAYRLMFRNTRPAPFTLSLGSKGGRIPDYLDYREVSDILKKPDTIVEFDTHARVPYLLTDNGYTWISYENEQSIREKVKFALDNNLGGYMTWNLNSDDFTGTHHISGNADDANKIETDQPNGHSNQNQLAAPAGATYPLHRAMFDEVFKYFSSTARSAGRNGQDHHLDDSARATMSGSNNP